MRKIAPILRGTIVALAIISGIFMLTHGLADPGVGTVTPTIVTTPNPTSGPLGTVLNDSATLSDGINPTGTITFNLYGVNDQTCGAAPIFTKTVPVSGNGVYSTSNGFTAMEPGTYHWIATYSGDGGNDSVSSICANEAVVIQLKPTHGTGESPYVGIVGNDIAFNPFYFSKKHQQFLYDQEAWQVPVCFGSFPSITPNTRVPATGEDGCEQFRSNKPINQPEICDVGGTVIDFAKGEFEYFGNPNAVITKQNAGYFEWWIRLPKKPSGEINVCVQCGVLKPNTFTPFTGFSAVEQCAAETGERIGTGWCTQAQVKPPMNPIINGALPRLEVVAWPGPYAPVNFSSFHLTAYKNPSNYYLSTNEVTDGSPNNTHVAMANSGSLQVLDGSLNARILLKSCMDKCVVAKIPVTDQVNALGETEFDLEPGDMIQVRLTIPIQNTVDIYCHAESAKIVGVADGPF